MKEMLAQTGREPGPFKELLLYALRSGMVRFSIDDYNDRHVQDIAKQFGARRVVSSDPELRFFPRFDPNENPAGALSFLNTQRIITRGGKEETFAFIHLTRATWDEVKKNPHFLAQIVLNLLSQFFVGAPEQMSLERQAALLEMSLLSPAAKKAGVSDVNLYYLQHSTPEYLSKLMEDYRIYNDTTSGAFYRAIWTAARSRRELSEALARTEPKPQLGIHFRQDREVRHATGTPRVGLTERRRLERQYGAKGERGKKRQAPEETRDWIRTHKTGTVYDHLLYLIEQGKIVFRVDKVKNPTGTPSSFYAREDNVGLDGKVKREQPGTLFFLTHTVSKRQREDVPGPFSKADFFKKRNKPEEQRRYVVEAETLVEDWWPGDPAGIVEVGKIPKGIVEVHVTEDLWRRKFEGVEGAEKGAFLAQVLVYAYVLNFLPVYFEGLDRYSWAAWNALRFASEKGKSAWMNDLALFELGEAASSDSDRVRFLYDLLWDYRTTHDVMGNAKQIIYEILEELSKKLKKSKPGSEILLESIQSPKDLVVYYGYLMQHEFAGETPAKRLEEITRKLNSLKGRNKILDDNLHPENEKILSKVENPESKDVPVIYILQGIYRLMQADPSVEWITREKFILTHEEEKRMNTLRAENDRLRKENTKLWGMLARVPVPTHASTREKRHSKSISLQNVIQANEVQIREHEAEIAQLWGSSHTESEVKAEGLKLWDAQLREIRKIKREVVGLKTQRDRERVILLKDTPERQALIKKWGATVRVVKDREKEAEEAKKALKVLEAEKSLGTREANAAWVALNSKLEAKNAAVSVAKEAQGKIDGTFRTNNQKIDDKNAEIAKISGSPFAKWLVTAAQRERERTGKRLFVTGIYGGPGTGKTTSTNFLQQTFATAFGDMVFEKDKVHPAGRTVPVGRRVNFAGSDPFLKPGDGFRYVRRTEGPKKGLRFTVVSGPQVYNRATLQQTLADLKKGSEVLMPHDPDAPQGKAFGTTFDDKILEGNRSILGQDLEILILDLTVFGLDPQILHYVDMVVPVLFDDDEVRLDRRFERDTRHKLEGGGKGDTRLGVAADQALKQTEEGLAYQVPMLKTLLARDLPVMVWLQDKNEIIQLQWKEQGLSEPDKSESIGGQVLPEIRSEMRADTVQELVLAAMIGLAAASAKAVETHVPGARTIDQSLRSPVSDLQHEQARSELRAVETFEKQGFTLYRLTDPQSGSSIEVMPGRGNTVTSMKVKDGDKEREILFYPEDLKKSGGIPILWPFANRIKKGIFTWDGQEHRLSGVPGTKDAAGGNTYHGMVRYEPWKVEASGVTPEGVFITSSLDTNNFPEMLKHFGAAKITVTYRLQGSQLSVGTVVQNLDTKAIPMSLAFHPWFKAPLEERSRYQVMIPGEKRWVADSEQIPTGELPEVAGKYDLRQLTPIGQNTYDDVFTGLQRVGGHSRSVISDPVNHTQIEVMADSSYSHLVLFVPPDQSAISIEPQTSSTDAFNLSNRGIQEATPVILAPGQ